MIKTIIIVIMIIIMVIIIIIIIIITNWNWEQLTQLQSVTKVVKLAPPTPLFNVGCKLDAHFWSSLPLMASSDVRKHWVKGKWNFG